MAVWQTIYIIGAVIGLVRGWRDIYETMRDNFWGGLGMLLFLGLLWIPGSMLLAYLLVWIRGLDIPPPP